MLDSIDLVAFNKNAVSDITSLKKDNLETIREADGPEEDLWGQVMP